jgi:DNA polymerase/3'-5' exonuclease PolX
LEWRRAIDLAKDVRVLLQPACERVEIAGSLRRMRSEINDIEIVAIPKRDPFDQLQLRLTELVSNNWFMVGAKSKDGKKPPMGPRYYRLAVSVDLNPSLLPMIQLDIFAVLPPADFGVIYTIRTGSAEFSHWLVTEALRRGFKVQGGQLFKIHRDEQPWRFEYIPCSEERDLFQALGLDWVEPRDRDPGLFPAITMPGVALDLASSARQPNNPISVSTAPNQPTNQSSLFDNQSINQSINWSAS